jgi:hypothetical protein
LNGRDFTKIQNLAIENLKQPKNSFSFTIARNRGTNRSCQNQVVGILKEEESQDQ